MKLDIIYNEDCMREKGMKILPDKSIDMILCDLPYGRTACKWDTVLSFEPLWKEYKRIIKDNGAIVLTASQPFTSKLVMSNLKMFKYEWIWEKNINSNFMLAKKQPLRYHENIVVFYKNQPQYNPQMKEGKLYTRKRYKGEILNTQNFNSKFKRLDSVSDERYPKSILKISRDERQIHPTQKPVALMEYLIKTYTNEGDIILDNCIGSGTTAIAAVMTGRHYIGYETDREYMRIAKAKLSEVQLELIK